jgi:hypothetical protein
VSCKRAGEVRGMFQPVRQAEGLGSREGARRGGNRVGLASQQCSHVRSTAAVGQLWRPVRRHGIPERIVWAPAIAALSTQPAKCLRVRQTITAFAAPTATVRGPKCAGEFLKVFWDGEWREDERGLEIASCRERARSERRQDDSLGEQRRRKRRSQSLGNQSCRGQWWRSQREQLW